ncbi:MAG: hypothetical protein K6U74_19820, partial [Firmicutes bacterium]|nr:hypothetical protein [Bacillota bacterium]
AVDIAQTFFGGATSAVIASGEQSDLGVTLAMGPYAALLHAPILLAEPQQVTTTMQYLSENGSIQGKLIVGRATTYSGLR